MLSSRSKDSRQRGSFAVLSLALVFSAFGCGASGPYRYGVEYVGLSDNRLVVRLIEARPAVELSVSKAGVSLDPTSRFRYHFLEVDPALVGCRVIPPERLAGLGERRVLETRLNAAERAQALASFSETCVGDNGHLADDVFGHEGLPFLRRARTEGDVALVHQQSGRCLTAAGFPALGRVKRWVFAGRLVAVEHLPSAVALWDFDPVTLAPRRRAVLITTQGEAWYAQIWGVLPPATIIATRHLGSQVELVRINGDRVTALPLALREDPLRGRFVPACGAAAARARR